MVASRRNCTDMGGWIDSMPGVLALPVVREDLDDPALGNQAIVTSDHGFKLVTQGGQAGDLVIYLG